MRRHTIHSIGMIALVAWTPFAQAGDSSPGQQTTRGRAALRQHARAVNGDQLPARIDHRAVSVGVAATKQRSGDLSLRLDRPAAASIGDSPMTAAASVPPENDDCENATLISGEGVFPFDNTMAATDGPAHAACVDNLFSLSGDVINDVWYCWTAPCDGVFRIETCGLTTVDTRLAVYDGCACPATDERLVPFGCNEDACNSLQSSVGVLTGVPGLRVQAGQNLALRVGTFPGGMSCGGATTDPLCEIDADCEVGTCQESFAPAPGGTGEFSVTLQERPCDQPAENCQHMSILTGFNSNRNNFTVADDFMPADTGSIANICWWGSYLTEIPGADSFQVRYFDDAGGQPGNVIGGPFRQEAGSLTVVGPVDTFSALGFRPFEYSGTHAPVAVRAGQVYWVEITNPAAGAGAWFWESGDNGNGRAIQDSTLLDPYQGSVCEGTANPCVRATDCLIGQACVGDTIAADLAFCVDVPTSPASIGDGGDCCTANGTPGCDDANCTARVCACDPACCQGDPFGWDTFCAGLGFVDGCGAQVLCQDLCSANSCATRDVCGTLMSSIPGNCTISPLQSSEPDGTNPDGTRQSVLSFAPDTCDASQLSTTGYVVEVFPAGNLPAITDVQPVGADAALTFDALTPRVWTCFSHMDAAGTTCHGSWPGDVDGNGVADPETDMASLLACLDTAGACPETQADINRDGIVNVLDATREADVLNAAEMLTAIVGLQLSACPSGP